MPNIHANGITLHYEQQGSGEPLILIPFLSADHACYAFQVAEYSKHFTCISLTCAALAIRTSRKVPTPQKHSPTTLPLSFALSVSEKHMSPGSL